MKAYIVITLLMMSTALFSQRKHQVGFYGALLRQSAYTNTNGARVEQDFKPSSSMSVEAGLYYAYQFTKNLALQHNLHFGVLYHSVKTETPGFNNTTRTVITIDEAAYGLGYMPKLIYTPFQKVKQLQMIAGLGARYFFEVSVENYSSITLPNGAVREEIVFAKGTISNIIPNEKKWQYHTELGVNYDVNLAKKRILLKINPFYQYSLNTVYTGVYRYIEGAYVENGTFKNKVHQTGVRISFGLTL